MNHIMLPTHSSHSKRGTGVSFSGINQKVLFTLGWLGTSLIIMSFGYWHMRANSSNFLLICDEELCRYTSTLKGQSTEFARADLVSFDLAKIGSDGQISAAEGTFSGRRKGGAERTTLQIRIRSPTEEGGRLKVEKTFVFSPFDMGRRNARTSYNKGQKYVRKESDSLKISSAKTVTVLGALCLILGFMSSVVSCVFGYWGDTPRRLKKAA